MRDMEERRNNIWEKICEWEVALFSVMLMLTILLFLYYWLPTGLVGFQPAEAPLDVSSEEGKQLNNTTLLLDCAPVVEPFHTTETHFRDDRKYFVEGDYIACCITTEKNTTMSIASVSIRLKRPNENITMGFYGKVFFDTPCRIVFPFGEQPSENELAKSGDYYIDANVFLRGDETGVDASARLSRTFNVYAKSEEFGAIASKNNVIALGLTGVFTVPLAINALLSMRKKGRTKRRH